MAVGDALSGPSEQMIKLAEKLVDMTPWAGWCTFQKNGSDATGLAVRYARAAVGKQACPYAVASCLCLCTASCSGIMQWPHARPHARPHSCLSIMHDARYARAAVGKKVLLRAPGSYHGGTSIWQTEGSPGTLASCACYPTLLLLHRTQQAGQGGGGHHLGQGRRQGLPT